MGLRALKCDGNHQHSSRFVLLETQHYSEVMYRAILRSLSSGTFDLIIFAMFTDSVTMRRHCDGTRSGLPGTSAHGNESRNERP